MNEPIFFTPDQAQAAPPSPPKLKPVRTELPAPTPPPAPRLPAPATAPVERHTPPTAPQVTSTDAVRELDNLLRWAVEAEASDVYLAADRVPLAAIHGEWEPVPGAAAIPAERVEQALRSIMRPELWSKFEQTNDIDLSYRLEGVARLRVNVLRQQQQTGSVMRIIPSRIRTVDELDVPEVLRNLIYLPRGLVIISGPTGSGKTTLLASLIDHANRNRKAHILTIEAPLEFVHEPIQSVITHREVGSDTASFESGLEAGLREAPNIILVGEMRDYESASIALRAAESGHLVFSTLHTRSAPDAVTRIVDMFPDGQQNNVRAQLAASLEAVVVQTLLRRKDGNGRVPAQEIMRFPTAVRSLIRAGKLEQLHSELQTGAKQGMKTLNADLARLVRKGEITREVAEAAASDINEFNQALNSTRSIA